MSRPTKREPSSKIELKYTQKKISRTAVTKVIRYRSETERFNEILSPLTIPRPLATSKVFRTLVFFRFIEERYQKETNPFPSSISKLSRLYKILFVAIFRNEMDHLQMIVVTNSVINWKFGKKYISCDTFVDNSYMSLNWLFTWNDIRWMNIS